MKLSPGDLKVTRPATKVDEQEKERIEEAINVTSAKMYDKAMELDTQHSVEYIEAAELAALSALSLPTAAHAAGLAASLRQGHTLAVTAVNQTFALDSGTAPEVKPAGGSATSDADKQFLEQLISRFALDCDVQLDPNKPIVDQLRNQAIQAEIADRLANSDPNGFVPIATHEQLKREKGQVEEALETLRNTLKGATGDEISVNGTKYIKLEKFNGVVSEWQTWSKKVAKAIKTATDAGKKAKKSKVPGAGHVLSTEDATTLGDAHKELTTLRGQLPGVDDNE